MVGLVPGFQPAGRPPAAGRADLLRALAARGEEGLAGMAAILGYREEPDWPPEPPPPSPKDVASAVETAKRRPRRPSARAAADLAPVPFWRLDLLEPVERKETGPGRDDDVEPLRASDLEATGTSPMASPIVPWSRLWPALHRALRSAEPSREVDAPALVERWGRGEMVERLPRRRAFAWSRRVTIAVDRSRRLIPFWRDQDELCRRLRRRLGRSRLRVVYGLQGPERTWTAGGRRVWRRLTAPPEETLLVLGDLGAYAGAPTGAAWARRGIALEAGGVRVRALVPCPAARWRPGVAALWRAVDWSVPLRTAAWAGGRRSAGELEARRERLLCLVSPAVRLEPGLLRAIRRLLPAREADIGTEADVWSHAEVDGSSSVASRLEASPDRRRADFRREPAALRLRVAEELGRWHAAFPEVLRQEDLALAAAGVALPEGRASEARHFFRRVSRTVVGEEGRDLEMREATTRWFLQAGVRLPPPVWADPGLRRPLARAWGAARRLEPETPLPPGITPAMIDDRPSPGPARRWTVWQVGDRLRFVPPGESPPAEAGGSVLATLLAADPRIVIAAGSETWGLEHELGSGELPCPTPGVATIALVSDYQRAELRRFVRPPWASAAGRDRRGLWAEMEAGEATFRLWWEIPGGSEDGALAAGSAEGRGRWVAETWPEWASAAGRDGYGLWTEVEVGEVAFRMRWIPPGRFWMGSPESEAGRYEWEGPRHQVTLTRGFWLGETPCTQALWEEVTAENPSRFRSPDRPVEQVSWDDCQELLKALNERLPGLEARLPTEAEWEYACRAGTETSTYTGELEILGKNNAPLLDGIAWYGGNSGVDFELENGYDSSDWPEKQYSHEKAGTHPVARKAPNPWGLYDMLGNVLEWCSDFWQDSYDEEAVEDPVGPVEGSRRVIRGGSWSGIARLVRSARRGAYLPGSRNDYLGFRLARGQEELGKAGRPDQARRPQGGERRGTRRRHRGPDPSEER